MTAPRTAERSSAKASSTRTAERSSAKASSARTLLHVTDCHLKAPGPAPPARSAAAPPRLLGVDTTATLAAVLDQALSEHRPEAVVASGDLAHDPEPATYRQFLDLVRQRYDGPVMYLPGNHDLGAPFVQVLGEERCLRLGGWDIIGFDTHVDHQTGAALDQRARAELAERIAASGADHVLLACHHHPLPVHCPWLDKDCIPQGREVLESCAAPAGSPAGLPGRVRALIFGHVHQQAEWTVAGLRVLGTPSTCFQFEPRSQTFALDRSADTGRPGYRWLSLHPDGSVASDVRRLTGYHVNIDLSEVS